MAVVLVPILVLALVGASGAFAQPTDKAERKFDAFLAQQAAAADGMVAGADIFADAGAECRTAFELELLHRAARPDGIVEADVGPPKRTITPPPHSRAFGMVQIVGQQRHREPAYFQLEQIARCLRALSWSLGAQQLRLEAQMREIKRNIEELKRER